MAERGEWSELDRISLDLKSSLNIPNLRPFLREKHLLTEAELEQVEISPINPRGQAIDKLVSFLKTKGPNHAEIFLEVLKMSLKGDDFHLGHESLCERLEAVMEEKKNMETLRQAVKHNIPLLGNWYNVQLYAFNVCLNLTAKVYKYLELKAQQSTCRCLPYMGK